MTICTHLNQIKIVSPLTQGCQDCEKIGDSWVALRLCKTCGHVGCCDSSKNRHARQHFQDTGHPIIHGLSEDWLWCYLDNDYVKEGEVENEMPIVL